MKVVRTCKCPWTRKLVKTNNCFLSFYTMQLLKNIAFLTIFTFFPLIHNLIYNLPDLHPHCSTKNKLFLVMKWNEMNIPWPLSHLIFQQHLILIATHSWNHADPLDFMVLNGSGCSLPCICFSWELFLLLPSHYFYPRFSYLSVLSFLVNSFLWFHLHLSANDF